ncbi:reverse transcriptase [Plakobranchus ocellatus]|uniref:Reverse transcriptase n=1 Tax=Plakobranchus ocellatus TaxID=259542 RepID=A0AAV4AKQ9_9GAST|nr:reverse transcriptase [Plakobranchus ocellatus]
MDTLRKQKRKLKKQIKAASSEETNGLLVIWRQLKARHSALSRAESARKKRSQKRKNQERFISLQDSSSSNPKSEEFTKKYTSIESVEEKVEGDFGEGPSDRPSPRSEAEVGVGLADTAQEQDSKSVEDQEDKGL